MARCQIPIIKKDENMKDISLTQATALADQYMTEKTIGLEIELLDPLNREFTVIEQASEMGIKMRSYNNCEHGVKTHWKFVKEYSVSGRELVSPPLPPKELFRQLHIILELLESNGYKVDTSCSVHVHHHAKKYSHKRLRYFLNHIVKNEVNFDCLVASSRRNGRWCRSMKAELDCLVQSPDQPQWSRCNDLGIHQCPNGESASNRGSARYRKWNFHSMALYGTVECRQHQGSLDFSKIVLWLALTQNMVSRCHTKVKYTKGWDNPMCNLLMSLGFAKRKGKAIKPHCPLAKWVCESVVSRMDSFGFSDRAPELDLSPDHLDIEGDEIFIEGCGWTPKEQLRILFPSLSCLV